MQWQTLDITVQGLKDHYRNKDFTPWQLCEFLLARMDADPASEPVWINRLSPQQIKKFCDAIANKGVEELPLYGVPFAIKDNIDLAGVPTTVACPAFAYTPEESAFVVQQLVAAGAIPVGKTNLDQFATGLVGVRSPYGICRNVFNDAYISGGSSSGSSVAVAKHWVSFSLGTDTAGSGRVPASLNNLVGVKPSRGLLSNSGLVPACKSLDCISIFALNCDDANAVLNVAGRFDARDAYARENPYSNSARYYQTQSGELTLGVPRGDQLEFFNNSEARDLFEQTVAILRDDGVQIVEIDFSPFSEAAKLLYEGPWVAERFIAAESLITTNPKALEPVIETIIGSGNKAAATDAFKAQYSLQACAQRAAAELARVDAVMTPTNGTAYTVDAVVNDPIALNSNLGYYTNFMNLLDYAALAVPAGFLSSGVGWGVTFFHSAFSDKRLLGMAARLQNLLALPAGAAAGFKPQGQTRLPAAKDTVDVLVCGAHLDGLALNWQLSERGANKIKTTKTAAAYAFYALSGGPLPRPALVRDETRAAQIEVEIWRMPVSAFGSFVAEIPAPLGIGQVELEDGSWCSGFICEAAGLKDAQDITQLGGWRRFLNG